MSNSELAQSPEFGELNSRTLFTSKRNVCRQGTPHRRALQMGNVSAQVHKEWHYGAVSGAESGAASDTAAGASAGAASGEPCHTPHAFSAGRCSDPALLSLLREFDHKRSEVFGANEPVAPTGQGSSLRMYKVVEVFDDKNQPVPNVVCVLEGTVTIGSPMFDSEGSGPVDWDALSRDVFACARDPSQVPTITKVAVTHFLPQRAIVFTSDRSGCESKQVKMELSNKRWSLRPMMASLDKATDRIKDIRYEIGRPAVEMNAGQRSAALGVDCVTGIHVSPSVRWAFALGRERVQGYIDRRGVHRGFRMSPWMKDFNTRSNLASQRESLEQERFELARSSVDDNIPAQTIRRRTHVAATGSGPPSRSPHLL